MTTGLILASQSPTRRAMLAAAGVAFEAMAAGIDEEPGSSRRGSARAISPTRWPR
jgi:predicted house-cleaning NTP pyrophosphatase (Maf/HAM1 superfamily)